MIKLLKRLRRAFSRKASVISDALSPFFLWSRSSLSVIAVISIYYPPEFIKKTLLEGLNRICGDVGCVYCMTRGTEIYSSAASGAQASNCLRLMEGAAAISGRITLSSGAMCSGFLCQPAGASQSLEAKAAVSSRAAERGGLFFVGKLKLGAPRYARCLSPGARPIYCRCF